MSLTREQVAQQIEADARVLDGAELGVVRKCATLMRLHAANVRRIAPFTVEAGGKA